MTSVRRELFSISISAGRKAVISPICSATTKLRRGEESEVFDNNNEERHLLIEHSRSSLAYIVKFSISGKESNSGLNGEIKRKEREGMDEGLEGSLEYAMTMNLKVKSC